MDQPVTIKAVVRSQELADTLDKLVGEIDGVVLTHEVARVEDVLTDSRLTSTADGSDVLLVDVDIEDQQEIQSLQRVLTNGAGTRPVVATSDSASVSGMRHLMRLQLADYVPQPFSASDLRSIAEIGRERRERGRHNAESAKVMSFIKPSGGLGATTLAIHTAMFLASKFSRKDAPAVCIVDMDVQFGNVATYMDVQGKMRLNETLENPDRIDDALLASFAESHGSGVDVLSVPEEDMVDWSDDVAAALMKVLEVACLRYDVVVLDMPQVWLNWTRSVLAGSDIVFLVTQFAVGPIRQARRMLDMMELRGISDIPLAIVANRYHGGGLFGSAPRTKEVEQALRHRIDYYIENDFRAVSEALNRGVPLGEVKARSKVEKQIRRMAEDAHDRVGRAAAAA